jgi:hypothetical protein
LVGSGWRQGPCKIVRGYNRVADNLPSKRKAHFPQSIGIPAAENNHVIRLASDDEVITVTPQRYLPAIFHETVPCTWDRARMSVAFGE